MCGTSMRAIGSVAINTTVSPGAAASSARASLRLGTGHR
jgi:hypothetical protein